MPFKGLFNKTDRLLQKALDGLAERQRVTAHNIANVDTPGYKRHRLSFEEALRQAQAADTRPHFVGKVTHPNHIPIGRSEDPLARPLVPTTDRSTTMRNDGNNVDIEAELAQLLKDQVLYNTVAEEAARRYRMLRDAITEGRR